MPHRGRTAIATQIAAIALCTVLLTSWARATKIVFVTSEKTDGSIQDPVSLNTGIQGADDICNRLAANATPPLDTTNGTYKAWLSSSTTSPSTTFTQSTGPYVRTDGAELAANWADLIDGTLNNTINLDENANPTQLGEFVWTGTDPDGTADQNHCNDWTTDVGAVFTVNGRVGATSVTDARWTHVFIPASAGGNPDCPATFRIYCVQQGPPAPDPGVFDFALDSLTVDGNIQGQGNPDNNLDFVDNFNDGSLSTLPTSSFYVASPMTESGGFLRIRSADGALSDASHTIDVAILDLPLNVGGGNSEVTASFRADTPNAEQVYGIGVGEGENVIWFAVFRLEDVTSVIVVDGTGILASDPVALPQSGSISLRFFINDASNEVVVSYSIDNGATFKAAPQFQFFNGYGTVFSGTTTAYIWAAGGAVAD